MAGRAFLKPFDKKFHWKNKKRGSQRKRWNDNMSFIYSRRATYDETDGGEMLCNGK